MIKIKRVYDDAEFSDGTRILVDRIWPRGLKKDSLKLNKWIRDIAPSSALRHWFKHDQAKWNEFKRRYFAELDSNSEAWQDIIPLARKEIVTLLYSAREIKYNNAAALKEYLEKHL